MLLFAALLAGTLLTGLSQGQGENATGAPDLEQTHDQDLSVTGFLSGILDSFTASSDEDEDDLELVNDCPGSCVNQLASLLVCDKVLENRCPSSQACCVENDHISPAEVLDTCPGACISRQQANESCEHHVQEHCPSGLVCCYKRETVAESSEVSQEYEDDPQGEESNKDNPPMPMKPCMGECRSMIFGLFLCDEIDNDAFCPESHQGCCIFHHKRPQGPPAVMRPPPSQHMRPPPGHPPAHMRPNPRPPQQRPGPPANNQPVENSPPIPPVAEPTPTQGPQANSPVSASSTEVANEPEKVNESAPSNNQQPMNNPEPPPMGTPAAPPALQPCTDFCIPKDAIDSCMLPYPRMICGRNAFCCGHNVRPILVKRPLPPPPQFIQAQQPPPPPPLQPQQEDIFSDSEESLENIDEEEAESSKMCPGQCIRPIMSFTCFLNAEMTDKYKCADPSMKCCAPRRQTAAPNATTPALPPPLLTVQPQPQPQPENRIQTPPERYVCGLKNYSSRRKRVVGGKDSLPGEWCWQVALINSQNQYLCGGALIGSRWVLTAAHCVTNIVRSGDAIYVRVGDHDLTSKYGSPGAQTARVITTYIHHNHNSQTLDNDIALLKLQKKVALNERVCLVCLPSRFNNNLVPGRTCTVTGYGYVGESGPIPLRVREAELPIVSETECIQKVNKVTEKPFLLPASSFCAGGEEANDACQGDGGGPLVCRHDDYYELSGLVSWGFGCGRKDVPGVYVNVSAFVGWINQIISISN